MGDFPTSLIMTILALVLVLVLAWFTIKMLARIGGVSTGGQRIKISQTVAIGAREKLMIVKCDDQEYLLGVTSNTISVLSKNHVPPTEMPSAGGDYLPLKAS